MSLDATVGGANSNSYATAAEGDAYFANRLYATDWLNAVTGTKEEALITATMRLEQEFYIGVRATSTQALSWPRAAAEKRDSGDVQGFGYGYTLGYYGYYMYYDVTEIPKEVKYAEFEYALILLSSDVLKQNQEQNYKSINLAGDLSIEFNTPIRSGILPDQVARLLRNLRVSGSQVVRS